MEIVWRQTTIGELRAFNVDNYRCPDYDRDKGVDSKENNCSACLHRSPYSPTEIFRFGHSPDLMECQKVMEV